MVKIPFHRRILPYLFTLIFIFMAPAVVFYTAGYRWNPKKQVIERNGTLIIDTVPDGASIKINNKNQPETTPITLQNMSPGSYKIELTMAGYHPWTKTLWIEPEMVTFATDLILWPEASPQFVSEQKAKLFSDADSGQLLAITNNEDGTSAIAALDPKDGAPLQSLKLSDSISPDSIQTNPQNQKQILIYGSISGTKGTWLAAFSPSAFTKLPDGNYHWSADGVQGQSQDNKIIIRSDQSVIREPKSADQIDSMDNWTLRSLPEATGLILAQGENAKQGAVLPAGNWNFWTQKRGQIILRDGERWLWIDTTENTPVSHYANADWLLPVTFKRETQYLFKHGNEVWVWRQGLEPELIFRQSEQLVDVSWHPEGSDVMVATRNEVAMFSLDSRDGRNRTVLADFDEITSAALAENTIYITGTKDNKTGLWKLPIAAERKSFLPLGKLGL